MGLVAGIGVGVLGGLARASGYRSATPVGITLTTLGVLVAANGPMTVLGVTDPRTWSATDWISDLVPHLAYGVVVKTTMDPFDRPSRSPHSPGPTPFNASRPRPPRRAPARPGRTG